VNQTGSSLIKANKTFGRMTAAVTGAPLQSKLKLELQHIRANPSTSGQIRVKNNFLSGGIMTAFPFDKWAGRLKICAEKGA
jgi:hypothetical protein